MISRTTVIVLIVFAVVTSGCDTMNWQQYRISGIQAGSADAQRIEVAVMDVADRYGLEDATRTSLVSNTLIFVTEPDVKQFHTDVGVRIYADSAIVDVMAGFGPRVPRFVQVSNALGKSLAAEFGERCVVLPATERVRDGLASYR